MVGHDGLPDSNAILAAAVLADVPDAIARVAKMAADYNASDPLFAARAAAALFGGATPETGIDRATVYHGIGNIRADVDRKLAAVLKVNPGALEPVGPAVATLLETLVLLEQAYGNLLIAEAENNEPVLALADNPDRPLASALCAMGGIVVGVGEVRSWLN